MVDYHPIADSFPLMDADAFTGLMADIEANGLRHPVVLFDGKILDGRNRYNACQKLGIPHREVPFHGDYAEAVQLVVSENIHRRHMTPAQLAIAAEKLATALQGRPRSNPSRDGEAPTTIPEAAGMLGASVPTTERVRAVRRKAVPEVADAMDAGEISPNAASNLARLPKAKQEEIMSEGDPRKIAVAAKQGAKAAGPGRGRIGPKVVLTRQMDLPDFGVVRGVSGDWEEHRDMIPELDPDKVAAFLAALKATRTSVTRLINLIEHGDVRGTLAKSASLKANSDKAQAKTTGAKADAKTPAAPKRARKTAAPKADPVGTAAEKEDTK